MDNICYSVVTMHVDVSTIKINGKTYTRALLRESYREDKKVKHRTIANISDCSPEEIEAIRLALRHKKDIARIIEQSPSMSERQGLSLGAVWTLHELAKRTGIAEALGTSRQGKLALWQVIARVIDQGSRLSAVRLAGSHAACDVLGLEAFNENNLYDNLDWLCENQATIEDRLFKRTKDAGGLFLYDVTSSYLEGVDNELSAFGYNRDGKKGKRQIVIGLLCSVEGTPVSIEVFTGNTQDPKTVANQIKKVAERFGGGEVTFVGDRGMIKSEQVEDLTNHGFHYITAITKPQIEGLIKRGLVQMEFFDQGLAEVKSDDGVRYVLRRNPTRAQEMQESREDKLRSLLKEVDKENLYCQGHQRANVDLALRRIAGRRNRLKMSEWVSLSLSGREIVLSIDEVALKEASKFDGCYVLKTDLPEKTLSKEVVHERYKDLALVETAFRSSKTVQLEMRPIHVRLETRTRGHVLVVMLAYRIVQELAKKWRQLDITVEEGIKELSTLCTKELLNNGVVQCNQAPQPRESVKRLLDAAGVRMPEALPARGVVVSTKKKLTDRRKAP